MRQKLNIFCNQASISFFNVFWILYEAKSSKVNSVKAFTLSCFEGT